MGYRSLNIILITVFSTIAYDWYVTNYSNKNNDIERNSISQKYESNEAHLKKIIQNTDGVFFSESEEYEICSEGIYYLGLLTDNDKVKYKIVTYSLQWGTNCRQTTRILIYSNENKYLGNFYTHGILPSEIIDNQLYFKEGERVSFDQGVPQKIQLDNDLNFKFDKAK